jgi:hypothetical protein
MFAVLSLLTYSERREPIAAGIAAPIQPFNAINASTFTPFLWCYRRKKPQLRGLCCVLLFNNF